MKRSGRSEKELDRTAEGAADGGATDTDGGDGPDAVPAGAKGYVGRGEGPVWAGYD